MISKDTFKEIKDSAEETAKTLKAIIGPHKPKIQRHMGLLIKEVEILQEMIKNIKTRANDIIICGDIKQTRYNAANHILNIIKEYEDE